MLPLYFARNFHRSENLRAASIILVVLAVVLSGACGLGKSKEELAAEALQRGLEAHFDGRLDEAAATYHEVLDLEPQNKYAFYNLGVIEDTAGRRVTAENFYRLALASDPNFVPALFNLAIIRNAAGAVIESIDIYRRATEVDPSYAEAHLNLGFALRSVGSELEAQAALTRAVELKPALASRVPPAPEPAPAGAAAVP